MLPYFTLLIVVFTLSYFVQTQQRVSIRNLNRNAHTQEGRWVLIAMTVILILFAGLRNGVGSDYGIYEWFYNDVYNGSSLFETMFLEEEGFFWGIISILSFLGADTIVFFLVCSIVTIVLIIKLISKYSINFSLSMFLYLAMMDYFNAFNGVRQWFAAAIIIAGFPWLFRNFWT